MSEVDVRATNDPDRVSQQANGEVHLAGLLFVPLRNKTDSKR